MPEGKNEEVVKGHIHLLCPYCFTQFDVTGPGMYTNAMASVECPGCDSRFYFMPVVFSDITPDKLQLAVHSFLKAQVMDGSQSAQVRTIGEIIESQKKRKGGDELDSSNGDDG